MNKFSHQPNAHLQLLSCQNYHNSSLSDQCCNSRKRPLTVLCEFRKNNDIPFLFISCSFLYYHYIEFKAFRYCIVDYLMTMIHISPLFSGVQAQDNRLIFRRPHVMLYYYFCVEIRHVCNFPSFCAIQSLGLIYLNLISNDCTFFFLFYSHDWTIFN